MTRFTINTGYIPRFGYNPDPPFTSRYVQSLQYPRLAYAYPNMLPAEKRTVQLWKPLLKLKPSWQRGAQGIGDCVSWGAEICATLLLAQQAAVGQSAWVEEAATEAIYGGCRVEALGERTGGYSDGAAGSWAAKWLNNFGVLCRVDYSQQTGVAEHDLRKYSADRAKEWGNYGCGGSADKGALDGVAKQYPVKEVTQVKTFQELEQALIRGCPVSVASMIGYGQMVRDANGICRRSGSWAHQMAYVGIYYTPGGNPLVYQMQSWGKSCSGPAMPEVSEQVINDCCWLTTPEDCEAQLRDDDSFAYSRVEGFAVPPWDFSNHFFV